MGRFAQTYQPLLMPAAEAARYIGISETSLRSLGLPRRVFGKRRLYLRYDLEAYVYSMEVENGEENDFEKDQAECDRLFGVGS